MSLTRCSQLSELGKLAVGGDESLRVVVGECTPSAHVIGPGFALVVVKGSVLCPIVAPTTKPRNANSTANRKRQTEAGEI